MKRILLLFILLQSIMYVCIAQNRSAMDTMGYKEFKGYLKQLRKENRYVKQQHRKLSNDANIQEIQTDSAKIDSANVSSYQIQIMDILDSAIRIKKRGFAERRGSYSFCGGYKNSLGIIGVRLDDRLLAVNTRFQFGAGLGFSSINGLKALLGIQYFLIREEKSWWMPLIGFDYIYSSGNQLINKTKAYYCTIGSHQYANINVGVKLKPWQNSEINAHKDYDFKYYIDFKVVIGYSLRTTPEDIDYIAANQNNWAHSYRYIKNWVDGGFNFAIYAGLDIPSRNMRMKEFKKIDHENMMLEKERMDKETK